MIKRHYLLLIIGTSLLMSACSRLPQRQIIHRAPAYSQHAPVATTAPIRRPARTAPRKSHRPRPIQPAQQHSQVSQIPRVAPSSPMASPNPARNQIVKIAHSTLGTRYKWGGNSPQKGFDCSGLMSYVHKTALGVNIPRTAAKQRDRSRTIRYEQLQPGDMLFFKTSRTSNHVGIYVGNRRFIHAPSGGKRVKITTMDSAYWHKRFVKFGTFFAG